MMLAKIVALSVLCTHTPVAMEDQPTPPSTPVVFCDNDPGDHRDLTEYRGEVVNCGITCANGTWAPAACVQTARAEALQELKQVSDKWRQDVCRCIEDYAADPEKQASCLYTADMVAAGNFQLVLDELALKINLCCYNP